MKNILRYVVALLLGGLLANCSEFDLPIKPATPTMSSHRTELTLSSNAIQTPLPLSNPINPVPPAFNPALVAPFAPTRVPIAQPAAASNLDPSNRLFHDRPPK